MNLELPLNGPYRVEIWKNEDEILSIENAEYWNDCNLQKSREWAILNDDYSSLEAHLREHFFPQDLDHCLSFMQSNLGRSLEGIGIDLAAGYLWAVPHLLSAGPVTKIYCLEYSGYRLLNLGPRLLNHFRVPVEPVVLALGSFYDIKLKDASLDFAFLCAAFHHAEHPETLLKELQRVLKPSGIVIIIGEHSLTAFSTYLKHFIKFPISLFIPHPWQGWMFGKVFPRKRLFAGISEILTPDSILGDHYYIPSQYSDMFTRFGFAMHSCDRSNSRFRSFVLIKKGRGA